MAKSEKNKAKKVLDMLPDEQGDLLAEIRGSGVVRKPASPNKPEDFRDLMYRQPQDSAQPQMQDLLYRKPAVSDQELIAAIDKDGRDGSKNPKPTGDLYARNELGLKRSEPSKLQSKDRHPGMPPSVANFDGAKIVRDGAAARVAERQAPRPAAAAPAPSPVEQMYSGYVPSGIKPAGGVRTGDPFLDVNTDFGALEADRQVKQANDQAFTQMNRARLSNISASREAQNSERSSRLAQMGKSPQEIERIMYPERFSDLRGEAMAQVQSRDKPMSMSQQHFDETQGRIGATSRTDALMRKARLNGQNLPYDQASAMAASQFPTTSAETVGSPSLPGLDPGRMAGVGPQAAQVAAMYGIGQGRNEVERQRNDNLLTLGQGQQGVQREGQNQDFMANLIRDLMGNNIANRQENRNDRVVDGEMGSPGQKSAESARQWLASPGAQQMQYGTPEQQAFYNRMLQQASGGGAAAPAAAGAPPTPQPPAAPGAQPATAGLPSREQMLASSPQMLSQHLATITDPKQREIEHMRILAAAAKAGGTPNPALRDMTMSRFKADDPNLAWGPDHWAQSYGGDQSIFQWMFGLDPISKRAADYAEKQYGVPATTALPWFQEHYDKM